jgi:hypothetical protein
MINNFIYKSYSPKNNWQVCKALLLACNAAALVVYAFIHLLFFDFPFEASEELVVLAKLFAVASCFALFIFLPFVLAEAVDYFRHNKTRLLRPGAFAQRIRQCIAAATILAIFLAACNGSVMVGKGIKKDFGTGLISTWSNLEPEKVMLVMNNEVLNHTDIPLGEDFLVVNDNVKGLTIKDGKVSLGCSLSISDKQGNTLLEEKDLFAGKDVFDAKEVKLLKCTVSTGKPMQWEENYDVAVTFWDKYGDGKIENKVTIRCIDMP